MQENTIQLPKKTDEGKPYISFSQYKNWRAKKSFNLGIEGRQEYILEYFHGYGFPDKGWAEFGNDVEDYICERKGAEKFTDSEKETLGSIETLGVYQKRFEIDLGEFVVIGYIDDLLEDLTKIRDYKTASKNSSKQYYTDTYWQLDLYAMWVVQQTGKIPELEVVIVERKGNCMFQGGREVLSVGNEVWYVPRETSYERLDWLKNDLIQVATEISDAWKVYQKLIS